MITSKHIDILERLLLAVLFIAVGFSAFLRPGLGVFAVIENAGIPSEVYGLGGVISGFYVVLCVLYAWRISAITLIPFMVYVALATRLVITDQTLPLQVISVYWYATFMSMLTLIRNWLDG